MYKFILLFVLASILPKGYSNRLPDTIKPIHYTLDVITYLDEPEVSFYFTGSVNIKILCLEETDVIQLHAAKLEIFNDTLSVAKLNAYSNFSFNHVDLLNISQEPKHDFLFIHLSSKLQANTTYNLRIHFKGTLTDFMFGYYKSSYTDKIDKETHWMAATHFEPVGARYAFPCFDEPAMKATFQINLGRKMKYSSISNMPLQKTIFMPDKEDWVWDKYQTSVVMSTYLVAYIVSDFEFVSTRTCANTTINIWARKDGIRQAAYAEEISPSAINFLSRYLSVPYSLPKMDMFALPDFSSGAMENWGLITFREEAVLHEKNVSSSEHKNKVLRVVLHELTHQWFGNLVTMKWWDDIFLNEAFASYFEALLGDTLCTEWSCKGKSVNAIKSALEFYDVDVFNSMRPISHPVPEITLSNAIFDVITYRKGAFVLRMLNNIIGTDLFRYGLKNYLGKYAYGNADHNDLWNAITNHKVKRFFPYTTNLTETMNRWILQSGYPLITVERNYNTHKATLVQERFTKSISSENDDCWFVPITYTTEREKNFNNVAPRTWMTCPNQPVVINVVDPNGWLILNIQFTALYKVNYDATNWERIIHTLTKGDHHIIPDANKVMIVNNAFELASIGRLSYSVPLRIFEYLQRERSALVWTAALQKFRELDRLTRKTNAYGQLMKYLEKFLIEVYKKFFTKIIIDSSRVTDVEKLITNLACEYNLPTCTIEALKLYKGWRHGMTIIDSSVREQVLCTAMRFGGANEWHHLWKVYRSSSNSYETNVYMKALACTKKTWLLHKYINAAITDNSEIRKQNLEIVFTNIAKNKAGHHILLMDYQNSIERFFERVPSAKVLNYLLPIAKAVTTKEEMLQLQTIVHNVTNMLKRSHLSLGQVNEQMMFNIMWGKHLLTNFKEAIQERLGVPEIKLRSKNFDSINTTVCT